MTVSCKEKEELIETFGQHFEIEEHIPPLAGRILAHLIIDSHRGITFDELVELLKASKSSVSTNLNILLHKNRIGYHTLPGDRKKYYSVTSDHIVDQLEDNIRSCEKKFSLCEKIMAFKKRQNSGEIQENVKNQLSYLENFMYYLQRYKGLCQEQKEKLIKLNTSAKSKNT